MIENKLEGNEEADCERWECKSERDGYTNIVRALQLFLSNCVKRIDLQNKNNDVRVKIFESNQLLPANMKIISRSVTFCLQLFWALLVFGKLGLAQKITYTFPEFPYKETNKNVRTNREGHESLFYSFLNRRWCLEKLRRHVKGVV